jgi:hypothetical protein
VAAPSVHTTALDTPPKEAGYATAAAAAILAAAASPRRGSEPPMMRKGEVQIGCRSVTPWPILDLKVTTVARDVARLCATFRDFPRLWFAMLRDFIENIANDRTTLILMTSFFFVLRPSATFRDLQRTFATLVRDFGRDCAKVKSRIGLHLQRISNKGGEEERKASQARSRVSGSSAKGNTDCQQLTKGMRLA